MGTMLGVGEVHTDACALVPGGDRNKEMLFVNQKVFMPKAQQPGFLRCS